MGNICWVASYPKSGNTWMRAFIENYLQNLSRPVNINDLFHLSTAESQTERYQRYVGDGKVLSDLSVDDICAIRPFVQADIAREGSGTHFVKTHNFLGEFGGYPLHNSGVTSGAIYIVRNPLDVAISLANYFGYSLDQAIESMSEDMTGTPNEERHVPQIISSWSVNVESWTGRGEPGILVLRYEDLLDKPLKEFRKVESFLGVKKDPERLKKAIRFSSFEQLKKQENKGGFVEKYENDSAFFRRGQKGQWRDQLSDDQVDRIVLRHREQMARFKYLPEN